jgi:hypothetical protein
MACPRKLHRNGQHIKRELNSNWGFETPLSRGLYR